MLNKLYYQYILHIIITIITLKGKKIVTSSKGKGFTICTVHTYKMKIGQYLPSLSQFRNSSLLVLVIFLSHVIGIDRDVLLCQFIELA